MPNLLRCLLSVLMVLVCGCENHFNSHFDRGRELMDASEPEKALVEFNEALAHSESAWGEDLAGAYHNRAVCYYLLEEYEKALADEERAIELAPGYDLFYTTRGNSKRELGRPEEALADYELAFELNPDDSLALLNKAKALAELKRADEAVAAVEAAVELGDFPGRAWLQGGEVYQKLDLHQKAVESFSEVLEISPDYSKVYLMRAQSAAALGANEAALKDLKTLEKLEADSEIRESAEELRQKLESAARS